MKTHFQQGLSVQESKQEITKIVSHAEKRQNIDQVYLHVVPISIFLYERKFHSRSLRSKDCHGSQ